MSESKRLPHFTELDGVRGIAALAVFVHHFFNESTDQHFLVCKAASLGYLGVQIFFVLSGFLISALLFTDRRNEAMIRNFYWKRVLRIWPALIIYLCAAYTLTAASVRYVALSLLFVSNFTFLFHPYELGPSWTLAIEEQFYLVWPQVVRRFRVDTVFWISLAIYLLSVASRTLLPIFRHDRIGLPYTPYQCDGLALGALLACQWFSPEHLSSKARRVATFLNGPGAIALYSPALVVAILAAHRNLKVSLEMTLATFLTYRLLALIVLKGDRRFEWLKAKPLVFLGTISYSLYLYHGIILERIVDEIGPLDMTHPSMVIVRFVISLALAVSASYLSLKLVELPIRKLRKHVVQASVPISA